MSVNVSPPARVCVCVCAPFSLCVCVCVRFMLSAYPLPLSMLPAAAAAAAAQLNLSQRWFLMSFSSVGVARLARLDVHSCDRFSISLSSRLATGLKDSFVARSVFPVFISSNVCRYFVLALLLLPKRTDSVTP